MNCPKCGMARAIDDRVCRRCRYFFEEDRFVDVVPPRSGGPALPREPRPLSPRARTWLVYAAALVPGLGHFLSGNRRRGLFFFGLVAVLATLSVLLFTQLVGRICFGLAVSAHAFSIFDLTPWGRSPELHHRVLAMGAILCGLLVLYQPVLSWLANRFVRPEAVAAGRTFGGVSTPGLGQFAFLAILFIVSVGVSLWLSRRLRSRRDA
ncbi:MAG: hypothetical protein HYY17_16230 [Planctomycetes bacterium]|nr:hypothetical protein [Planctomycetota bacterium]